MGFMTSIINTLNSVSSWFHQLYLDSYYAGWPLRNIADWFYSLHRVFNTLAERFYDFSTWVSDVTSKVAHILSQVDIINLLRTWLTYAENAWSWVLYSWQNVTSIINTWWDSTSQVVLVWVRNAKDYATALYSTLQHIVASLQADWDSFKGKLPTIDAIISWWGNLTANILLVVNTWWRERLFDIQSLIDSAFIARQGLWAGWQDWRGKVTEFFTDPEEWLYKAADRIVERFW